MRLKEYFNTIVKRDILYKLGKVNPKIISVTLHITLKETITNSKQILPSLLFLEWLSNQKVIIIKAKHSVSTWKLRKGMIIGCKVTMHNDNMWQFLDDLLTFVLPRSRNKKESSSGSFGITDPLLFPQIEEEYDFFNQIKGVDIIINTNFKDKEKQVLLSSIQI